jgi:hypothetical protein
MPATVNTSTAVTGDRVFGSQEYGVQFTVPANVQFSTKVLFWMVSKQGSPTGQPRLRVYSGDSLLATSLTPYAAAHFGSSSVKAVRFPFSSAVTFTGGTAYRIALGDTSADSSSAYYLYQYMGWDSDSGSATLLPFGGTLRGAVCAGTCAAAANWTTNYNIPTFGISLEPGSEFDSVGGAGGQKGFVWIQ